MAVWPVAQGPTKPTVGVNGSTIGMTAPSAWGCRSATRVGSGHLRVRLFQGNTRSPITRLWLAPKFVVFCGSFSEDGSLPFDNFAVPPTEQMDHVDVQLLAGVVRSVTGV